MDKIAKIIGLLFMSRNMAHKAHLKTGSLAAHNALVGFYEALVSMADSLAEAAQGKYGLYDIEVFDEKGDVEDPLVMLETHLKMYQTLAKTIDDRYLQNIADEIEALFYSTIYKLKFLK